MEREIQLVDALIGFSFKFEHLDGSTVIAESKKGDIVKAGDIKELPRQGMPIYGRTYESGSIFIKFDVIFPNTLNASQINSLKTIFNPSPEPTVDGKVEKVTALPFDQERLRQRREQQQNNNDSDEEGHGQGSGFRTNCSQQ